MSDNDEDLPDRVPGGSRSGKMGRAALSTLGSIPFAGGLFSAAAGFWSEHEQEKVNHFLTQWLQMLDEELKEKEQTILEITSRLDMQDESVQDRISSDDYQALLKRTFRQWSSIDTKSKRTYVRNILSNAAATTVTSDDVIRMFLDWLNSFSDLHFEVIRAIFNSNGITRGQIWQKINKQAVREDSAEADLFKLLIRDLSMGSIIRQYREVDYAGNFIKKHSARKSGVSSSNTTKSAFSDDEGYELTALGKQFVHYAMNELPIKIGYDAG